MRDQEFLNLFYHNLLEQENARIIKLNTTESCDIDSDTLDKNRIDLKERLKLKLITGACSSYLIDQLSMHRAHIGEKFGDKIEFINSSEVLDYIHNLEKGNIEGLLFNNEPLSQFKHIHLSPFYSKGEALVRNVKEYWFNSNGQIRKSRTEELNKILHQYKNTSYPTLAIVMHNAALRNKDLKGEWLIYLTKNNKNFYLCLASHKEGKNRKESDMFIFEEKIKNYLHEIPE